MAAGYARPVPLRIIADQNIPLVAQAFAELGEVVTLPSRALSPAAVHDADLVLVRSTVRVGPELLEGSRVRFVATATIGTDHLDRAWLDARGIAWAAAPGSNADSVVQWFSAALLAVARRLGLELSRLQVGIVGVGAVGGRIEQLCRALGGPAPLLCDPPRARREGAGRFLELDEVLGAADLVTFHVPLERGGADPTYHLLEQARLDRLRPGTVVINSSRGAVVDGAALERALAAGRVSAALDVWESEPSPSPALVERCLIATPHIAGHSLDGKVNGTRMVHQAACNFLGVTPHWRPALPPATRRLELETTGRWAAELVLEAVRAGYQLEADDAALRAIARLPENTRASAFQNYRDEYPPRRELDGVPVALNPARDDVAGRLAALGLRVA